MARRLTFNLWAAALLLVVTPPTGAQSMRFEAGSGSNPPPAPFVYDPLTQTSAANTRSHKAATNPTTLRTTLKTHDSFTIEAFAKPVGKWKTKPRQWLPVLAFADGDEVLRVGIRRSTPPHSYNWWQARLDRRNESPLDLARSRYNGLSMVRNDTPWRHVAFVWNAAERRAAFYLDYQLQASATLDAAPKWKLDGLTVGGDSLSKTAAVFDGLIDEVRVTAKPLPPWQFLRVTNVNLKGASFAPERSPGLPDGFGHVDVRLHYGAVGDGVHDDTEAIRRAFADNDNRVPVEYKTVYFPAGTYLISDSIRFSRFMVVRGAGRDKTVIRLKDNAEGYATPDEPKPAFAMGYDWPYVGRTKRQRAGNAIGSYIFDLAIDTGRGNPSALGLDFHTNNHGCVQNVDIRSGDGAGMIGLDFKRGRPGPCLIKNVSITGFDHGIAAAHREYSLVFCDIKLQDQRVAAIVNGGNVLSMENVQSDNGVPAVLNRGGGLVVLINSQLRGGAADATAIDSDTASLYLRNVSINGYGTSVLETTTPRDQPSRSLARLTDRQIDEHFTGPLSHRFEPQAKGSLKLPIKQTPDQPLPPVSQWTNVTDFARLVKDGDWTAAIQAAVDAGQPLVYFPPDLRYAITRDVVLRGKVRIFLGASPKTSIATPDSDRPEAAPAFVLDPALPTFTFHMLATRHIRHPAATRLILEHCNTGHVSASPGCGDLFIENAGGKFRFGKHQRVWGRQLNPETKGIPEIVNDGATLWILGLKTEYLSTQIVNRNGARTELLGGLMYPVHAVNDETLPMFINENSDISLVHAVSVYKKNYKIYMHDTRDGPTGTYTDWHWVGGRPIMNLYRSSGRAGTE